MLRFLIAFLACAIIVAGGALLLGMVMKRLY